MWTFGTQELISLIAAFATFCAIAVSLFLALKSKTVRFKVHVKDNKAALIILNTGETKFTVNGIGIKNDDFFYMNPHTKFSKLLSISKQVEYSNGIKQNTRQELSIGQVVLEQGDFVEVGLSDFNFSLCNLKAKFFLVINCKVYLFSMNLSLCIQNSGDGKEYKKFTENEVRFSGLYTGI